MALEIEKMTSIQGQVTEEEAKDIGKIIDTLSKDFRTILSDSREFILTGEKVTRDFSESISALNKIKAYGERFGVEFPEIDTNEKAAVYLLKFGREIVLNR